MKRPFTFTALGIGGAMAAAAVLAVALKPTTRLADQRPPLVLEKIVPADFGGWQVDKSIVPVTVSPDVQSKLDVIYNQTLNRTYINANGQRVMLSIAYGGDQSGDGTQVHRPEFCYAAQGFQLTRNVVGDLATRYGALPVRRLMAVQGRRNEPITYWVTVGDKATVPGLRRKLSQLAYGLTGKVPDGMLVRVSSIDADTRNAYGLQQSFIDAMLGAMPPQDRVRIAGKFGA
jgi:EpsI family protein